MHNSFLKRRERIGNKIPLAWNIITQKALWKVQIQTLMIFSYAGFSKKSKDRCHFTSFPGGETSIHRVSGNSTKLPRQKIMWNPGISFHYYHRVRMKPREQFIQISWVFLRPKLSNDFKVFIYWHRHITGLPFNLNFGIRFLAFHYYLDHKKVRLFLF